MESNLTNQLLQAILSATDDQKSAALRVLEGKPIDEEPAEDREPFVPLGEIARRLTVHVTTLRRWRVPGRHLGRCSRHRLSEVLAYLESDDFRRREQDLKDERRRKRRQQQAGAP